MSLKARIKGIGKSVPEKIVTNFDLEKTIDTSDEWIRTRTGIVQRHIIADDCNDMASDLGAKASLEALENSKVSAEDIDCIMCATFTPDNAFPSTACSIQKKIGAKNAMAFDLSAACSGFLYGLALADSLIRSKKHKKILLVGSETISKVVDWKDRNTCVLFGDGAGAVVISAEEGENGILSTYEKSDGELGTDVLSLSAWGENRYIKMNGNKTFKYAVQRMSLATKTALSSANLEVKDIDYLVPHQANTRIMTATAEKIDIPVEKVIVNVDKYGNTSSASIPLALYDAVKDGRIKENSLVAMTAFGGGLTWGSVVVRW